ncbi:hypothetical protein ACFQX4_19730 [Roseomonas sp. GCM10028921]
MDKINDTDLIRETRRKYRLQPEALQASGHPGARKSPQALEGTLARISEEVTAEAAELRNEIPELGS